MKRRAFLQAGALLVSFAVAPRLGAAASAAPFAGSLKVLPQLDGWIRLGADGQVTVLTGKAELGQGIKTALIQLAAEELVLAPARITLITADTERTANEGFTAGSHSMQDSGTAIRAAAATMRALLGRAASARWNTPVEALRFEDGVIYHGSDAVPYQDLIASIDVDQRVPADAVLLPPSGHRIVGQSWPRVDIPAKVTGGAAYVQDVRLPGMLHARVLRLSAGDAAPDADALARLGQTQGVVAVVVDGRFVAVVCDDEFVAVSAHRSLRQARRRGAAATPRPAQQDLADWLLQASAERTVILQQDGATGAVATSWSARYFRPYQMHASIGPSCAVALLQDGKYTVYTHTQGVYPLRHALAEMLGVADTQVHCIHTEGSGCYGHNGADDVAADAVLIARAMPGRPVRVQWMREDEHEFEPLGPAMLTTVSAALDGAGRIAAWNYDVYSNTHTTRPGRAGNLLAATTLAAPFAPPVPEAIPLPEGGGDRNALPFYTFSRAQVVHHFIPAMPLRVSALRSLGAYMNVFSIESAMDELARLAGSDAIDFRLRHTDDARALAVMRQVREAFAWDRYARPRGHGRGFAFARYKNLAAYFAVACEVAYDAETSQLRVLRVIAAIDSGEIVNPDGVRNQTEGGILQSLSWTTMEEVAFDARGVTSVDWGGYPILRFDQVPETIEVHLIDRPGMPFLGTGEAAQGPTAAAIANALFDAVGQRARTLPLSRARLRQLISPGTVL